MTSSRKYYHECIELQNFGDRLEYLKLYDGNPESPRLLSQKFYKSPEWQQTRYDIIARDQGCDLGIPGMVIDGPILVHHIFPLVEEDFLEHNWDKLFNPNNLICVSRETHNKIHYRDWSDDIVERSPGDTKLW